MRRELSPKVNRLRRIDQTCSINFSTTIEFRERVRWRAASQGLSMSAFITRVLEEKLAEMDELDCEPVDPPGTTRGRWEYGAARK